MFPKHIFTKFEQSYVFASENLKLNTLLNVDSNLLSAQMHSMQQCFYGAFCLRCIMPCLLKSNLKIA